MLTRRGLIALEQIMEIGCLVKFFPFEWDARKRRLDPKISWFHKIVFNFHGFVQCFMLIFSCVQLLRGLNDPTMPPRIRVMNLLWILAYVHGMQGYLELVFKRDGILFMSNAVFDYIHHEQGKPNPRVDRWVSDLVILSNFLLLISPGIHGLMLIGNPCAPHFSSSIFLECKWAGEVAGTLLEQFPFFVLENYFVAVFFFLLAFNWFIVFLGLGWLRRELQEMSASLNSAEGVVAEFESIPNRYRHIQCVSTLLNESFRLYLSWAPMIFMAHVALLLFASFRYWDEDIVSYVMFPACGVRCMLDAVTPLALAGDVSVECSKALEIWKKNTTVFFLAAKEYPKYFTVEWMTMFQASCREISCQAGSLYKMERAILPVNINNMALLTLNLLVAIPHKPGQTYQYV